MKFAFLIMLFLLVLPAICPAQDSQPARVARAAASDASEQPAPPPVPENARWTGRVVLGCLWIFIAAILLGPIIKFFTPEPPRWQATKPRA